MRYCNECKLEINTETKQCPLCKHLLIGGDGTEEITYPLYRPYVAKKRLPTRIFAFIVIVATGVLLLVNLINFHGDMWSAIPIATLLYAWLVVDYTCMTHINLGLKLMTHAVGIPVYLVIINLFVEPGIYAVSWAFTYATPFIIMGFILAITITIAITKMRFSDYVVYQFSMTIIGFVPLILCLSFLGLNIEPIWPSIVAAFYSFITLLGIFLFGDRGTKDEIKKRFHIK